MSGRTITILDPTSTARPGEERVPGPVGQLRGKVVGILNNRWRSMDLMAQRFEELLRSRYGVAEVITRTIPIAGPAPVALLDEMAQKTDLTVVGLAN